MESNPSEMAWNAGRSRRSRRTWGLVRILIGVAVLVTLYYFGNFDLKSLTPLGGAPWTLAASGVLLLLTLPLSTLRWAIMLRVLDIEIPFVPLLRIACISMFVGLVLLGPTNADVVRGIYGWRALRRGAGRITFSIIVDRAVGTIALVVLATALIALKWDRVREVPQLMLLVLSLIACIGAGAVLAAVLLAVLYLLSWDSPQLQRYPQIRQFLGRLLYVLMAFRRRPLIIGAVLGLSVLAQGSAILAFVIIANALRIGSASLLDVTVAAPLAMVANFLPFTPGGLGVGEAAFDQFCSWLAPAGAAAPYASIFFAFRAVSMVMLIPGAISFVLHRSDHVASACQDAISGKVPSPQDPH
jgi:uncharacterized membrane protein YbhN (UPF0104 family)